MKPSVAEWLRVGDQRVTRPKRLHAVSFSRHFGPADQKASYYQYIPFEVTGQWRSVTVRLSHDRSMAVIDLGLFSPEGFRGWSGGERSCVLVSTDRATPGFLPGGLPTGEWLVALGLHQLPPEGTRVTVKVAPGRAPPALSERRPPVPLARPLRRPPATPGHRWVAGDLHAHSEHSDGSLSVAELAVLARTSGLDYLAVTDHNTVSHFASLGTDGRRYGVTLVPGQEITTPLGHANCLGETGWVDFRLAPDAWACQAVTHGGLLSVNHPIAEPCSWQYPISPGPGAVELWHQSWDRYDCGAIRFWEKSAGAVPVGGSDFHTSWQMDGSGRARRPGWPTTWVEVEDNGGAVFRGLTYSRGCGPGGSRSQPSPRGRS